MRDDIQAVRKRPGMYVGPLDDGFGLVLLVVEAVGLFVNDVRAGYATRVDVTLNTDGSCTIHGNGRGLSTTHDDHLGMSRVEEVLTRLTAHARPLPELLDLPDRGYISDNLCVVNALSSALDLHTWFDGTEYSTRFHCGSEARPLTAIGTARGRSGVEITFTADPTIFGNARIDGTRLATALEELAARTGTTISLDPSGRR